MTVSILLLISTLLPLLSFSVLVFVGKRMGDPIAGYVAAFFSALSFIASLVAMIVWLSYDTNNGAAVGAGGQPILKLFDWAPAGVWGDGSTFLQVGLYIDSLTIVMFSMVTLVTALVHVFSIGYMADDKNFHRFFTYLSLFSFAMLGLVLGATLLQLLIFWELVGLCSFLLIGFWHQRRSANRAATKAFIVNRIGDVGFLIGLGILFFNLGNLSLPDVWGKLNHAGQIQAGQSLALTTTEAVAGAGDNVRPDSTVTRKTTSISCGLLTVMGICLFFGAVGKSAQFPLHVWLPDAMEGPSPVSALVHAATMVAAGVYLVSRIFFILTPDAKLFIAVIGCITLTMGALIAVVQTDIKKILAYSTISQLGYMMLALGLGSWVGALFHLITHGFFKALLFLGAGSVIHAAHHEQDVRQYGGLLRKMPYTAITFGFAVLAIAGTPFFSGFYSKELILGHAAAFSELATRNGRASGYWLFFILPTAAAYLTAFYMARCWILTFGGRPRNPHLHERTHDTPILYIPLIVLAVLSVIGGNFLGVQQLLESSIRETRNYFEPRLRPVAAGEISGRFTGFDSIWQIEAAYNQDEDAPRPASNSIAAAYQAGHHRIVWATPAFAVGMVLAFLCYRRGLGFATAVLRIWPLRVLHRWLVRKMYFDELYNALVIGLTLAISHLMNFLDRYVIDAVVRMVTSIVSRISAAAGVNDVRVIDGSVNAVVALAQNVGQGVRVTQTGRIRAYVTLLVVAVTLGLVAAIVVVFSRIG